MKRLQNSLEVQELDGGARCLNLPGPCFEINERLWVWQAINWVEFANPLTSEVVLLTTGAQQLRTVTGGAGEELQGEVPLVVYNKYIEINFVKTVVGYFHQDSVGQFPKRGNGRKLIQNEKLAACTCTKAIEVKRLLQRFPTSTESILLLRFP
eukprot:1012150-Pelagomonas_calceolata.AAC.1